MTMRKRFKNKIMTMVALAGMSLIAVACATADAARMPISVHPYYDSDPLTINVGELSEPLMSENPNDILKIAEVAKQGADNIPLEALYVMAIRLFDLGEKTSGAYWYYNAQFRTKVLNALLKNDPDILNQNLGSETFEKLAAYNAFTDLAGQYINPELANDPNSWSKILGEVSNDLKDLDIRAFVNDFPQMANKVLDEHPEIVQKVNEGLNVLKDVLTENMQEIVNQTKKNYGH